jgi:hypothetical protein
MDEQERSGKQMQNVKLWVAFNVRERHECVKKHEENVKHKD